MPKFALLADRVWDGVADHAVENTAVILSDGRIDSVCDAAALPNDMPRRAFPGCTLTPGLIDSHVHYSSVLGPAFLAAGVTTIRDVGNDLEWILSQRASHADDPARGPSILCCGRLHNGARPHWPRMGKAHADVAELLASIQHHVARGVDQIKLYAGLNLEMLTAAVNESHRLDKFVLAHLGVVRAHDAILTGLNEFEHLDGCDVAWGPATPEEDDVMIDLMLKHKTVINPTFVVWDRFGRMLDNAFQHDVRREWVHPCHREIWERAMSLHKPAGRLGYQSAMPHLKRFMFRAHARGVTVAVGTDTPFPHLVPGFSLHDELSMYVDAGLRPVDALRAATTVNARVLGIEARAGRIAPGLNADLAVFRGNPLMRIHDVGNVECVVRHGHALSPAELLASVASRAEKNVDDPVTHDMLDWVHGRR